MDDGALGTRSYVVAMFDVTASFTHWGMYNISARTNGLPEGAGAAGSTYGAQVYNDFYLQGYDGPCPPVGVEPYSHQYVVTVYALDKELQLPQSAGFRPRGNPLVCPREGRRGRPRIGECQHHRVLLCRHAIAVSGLRAVASAVSLGLTRCTAGSRGARQYVPTATVCA